MKNFIRTKKGCYALAQNKLWGKYYIPHEDPAGEDTPSYIDTHTLLEDFPKLPYDLFKKIFTLFKALEKQGIEVQVVLGRLKDDNSVWTAFVPEQQNTVTKVNANIIKLISLETEGIEIATGLPVEWSYAGTMHLHPANMGAFWSSTDDKSELGNPGMHCTLSMLNMDNFNICASICLNGKRYVYKPSDLIELGPEVNITAKDKHSYFYKSPTTVEKIPLKCFEYIKRFTYAPAKHYGKVAGAKTTTGFKATGTGATTSSYYNWDDFGFDYDYVNPHYNNYGHFDYKKEYEDLVFTISSYLKGNAHIIDKKVVEEINALIDDPDLIFDYSLDDATDPYFWWAGS